MKKKIERKQIDLGISALVHLNSNEIQKYKDMNFACRNSIHFGTNVNRPCDFYELQFQNRDVGISCFKEDKISKKRIEQLSLDLHNAIIPVLQNFVDENNEKIKDMFKEISKHE